MSEPLDRAVEALRSAPVPPGPPPELVAATVAAVAERAKPIHAERRRRIMQIARYGTAGTLAAGVLVAAGVFWAGAGSAHALEDALKKAAEAKSVRVVHKVERDGKTIVDADIYWHGNLSRFELIGKLVRVVDTAAGQVLELDVGNSTAARRPATARDTEIERHTRAVLVNPLNRAENRMNFTVRPLPDKRIDERRLTVYEVTIPAEPDQPAITGELWVDAETTLPVRFQGPGSVLEFSRWNEEFDPKLFSLDVPAGYRLIDPATMKK